MYLTITTNALINRSNLNRNTIKFLQPTANLKNRVLRGRNRVQIIVSIIVTLLMRALGVRENLFRITICIIRRCCLDST